MTQPFCKDIVGFEGKYKICRNGDVLSMPNRINKYRTIKLQKRISDGYVYVQLYNKHNKFERVSRLVAKHFLPNPNNFPVVNHIDGNKLNNDVTNLEWCTQSHNMKHAFALGLRSVKGEKGPTAKLTNDDILKIRRSNLKQIILAAQFGIHQTHVSRIKSRKCWGHI